MSADAVDFRLHILHGELVFRYQVHFVLQTMNKHTDGFLTPMWTSAEGSD